MVIFVYFLIIQYIFIISKDYKIYIRINNYIYLHFTVLLNMFFKQRSSHLINKSTKIFVNFLLRHLKQSKRAILSLDYRDKKV